MTLLLISIVLISSCFSLYLISQLRASKKMHIDKVKSLEGVISDLLKEQKKQSFNLKLSDELKNKLLESRISLDENIMELQYDLVSVISKKN